MGRTVSGILGFVFTLAAGVIVAISLWTGDHWITKTIAVFVLIISIYAAYVVFKYLKQHGYLGVSEARRSNEVDYLKPTPYDTYRIYKAENIESETADYFPLMPKRIFIFGREVLSLKTHKFTNVKFSENDRSIAFKTEYFTLIVKNPSTIFDDPHYIKCKKAAEIIILDNQENKILSSFYLGNKLQFSSSLKFQSEFHEKDAALYLQLQ